VEFAVRFRPTVILQDLMLPGIDGFELLAQYRETEELCNVPVIILSATDDPLVKERSFLQGANDYLVKLPDHIELLARVRYHSGAYLARCERDESFHLLKVSQQQLAEANLLLHKLNGLDPLTGVANRRRFDEVIASEWQRGLRQRRPLSVLMCDIDHFKQYNDNFGHVSGDFCIKRTAEILMEQLRRPGDLVVRYGGEEFVILLPETDLLGALRIANTCRKQIENLIVPHGVFASEGRVTLSIGVCAVVPSSQLSIISLMEAADAALYEAKRNGRNQIAVRELLA
jgi:two-component system chemotaxis family response regulator WspR